MEMYHSFLIFLVVILVNLFSDTHCVQQVACKWGPYGDWSECDGCTKTQGRTRSVQTFAQFGGAPCTGQATQTQECVPAKKCPLESGCGDRFRCSSGKCVSASLVCNGDHDCEEDSLDEQRCDEATSNTVCDEQKTPPHSEHSGLGYDTLTEKLRAPVINTKSFGGQCRKVFSGDHRSYYRLPQSILRYTFQVGAESDFSEELYDSSWSYMKHFEKRHKINGGHDHYTSHYELKKDKSYKLLIIKSEVEVAQFQNNAPRYLPLSEEFWKALSGLPVSYEASAYRSVLQRFGTHYMSEGSLGGRFEFLLELDSSSYYEQSQTVEDFHRCITRVKRILFWKKKTTKCDKVYNTLIKKKVDNPSRFSIHPNIAGGYPAYAEGLKHLNLNDPEANHNMYTKWAGTVKSFPVVIKEKLRPLYELVKEVPCAGVKKLHLKRALEEYLVEQDACHCRPCNNNGQPKITGSQCSCFCKPGTHGLACQGGSVVGGQPGVIDGGWSCWSTWTACSGGQRSRSRLCNNPSPRSGGMHCSGEAVEKQPCEDPDMDYLRMMEPHCFDPSVVPVRSCKAPPALINGFVLTPKDLYAVGSKVEYSCVDGHYLQGQKIVECTDDLTWRKGQMECKKTACDAPPLQQAVIGSPVKPTYQIGDRVSLSCPDGMQRVGESEVACSSSLMWSPPADSVECRLVPKTTVPPALRCKPWEKPGKEQCVCKAPNECEHSFPVCVSLRADRMSPVGVCKLGALQCLGRSYTLVNDSSCDWPKQDFTSCEDCRPWEKCTGQACVCKEPEECPEADSLLCVALGDGSAPTTMSECEVGMLRCHSEPFVVSSIGACSS
ncbi:complement component 7b isoform X2 [Sardina pilchardus]|uniref:complement component 7b isoform X2 n=1 Tax=Sardina pilchardus TaxID=27697 RepID=UPI002E15C946